jgi:hypothetical protein
MVVALGLALTVRSERTRAKEELAKEEAVEVT